MASLYALKGKTWTIMTKKIQALVAEDVKKVEKFKEDILKIDNLTTWIIKISRQASFVAVDFFNGIEEKKNLDPVKFKKEYMELDSTIGTCVQQIYKILDPIKEEFDLEDPINPDILDSYLLDHCDWDE